jgi:hypothetical protein
MTTATPTCQRRFLQTFERYLDSVGDQARDRDHQHIRSVEEYLPSRRENIGAFPSFAMAERDMDIPDDVMNGKELQNLQIWACELILLSNVSNLYTFSLT